MLLDSEHRMSLLFRLARMAAPRWLQGRLSILIYHRVHTTTDTLLPQAIDAKTFTWQVSLLKQHFNVLSLAQAVAALKTDRLPPRAVCITFDDGYADDVDVVLPILTRYGVSATFFIASGYLDGGRMWNDTVVETIRHLPDQELDLTHWGLERVSLATLDDRRRLVERLLFRLKPLPVEERERRLDELSAPVQDRLATNLMMRSEQVRRLHQAGMEIGSHTVSHPILASKDAVTVRREIVQGRAALEGLINAPVRFFAYPNGRPGIDYTAEHVAVVREAGFEAAVSTAWGVSTARSDFWQLPRFTPWDRTPERYALRLLHNYSRTEPVIAR